MPYQQTNDIQLYYQEEGTGPPLLLVHGLGSSSEDWQLQLPVFAAAGYRVIAADVRGHGRSGKPPGPYAVSQFASDLAQLLRRLDAAPAHLVGISMGGMIGFQLALDAPQLLRSLVIVNSGPALVPQDWRQHLSIWQRRIIVRFFSMERIGRFIGGRLFPESDQVELLEAFVQRWSQNDKTAYAAATRALIGWSVAERIGDIQLPLLVIAADQDYTPVADKEAYVRRLPNARLVVIPNSRHATPIDQPERFNHEVLSFLRQLPG